jgi:NADH dehydrogenase
LSFRGLEKPAKVVVVGAGFGGLNVVYALRGAFADVTVLDRHNYHYFQPLLYQVATAVLSPADIAWPIRSMFRRQKNVSVFLATVTGVDPEGKVVYAGAEAFPYDFLVLATGAQHSYFGHPEWAEFAPGLKSIEDAIGIRRSLLLAFEKAELAHSEAERRRLLSFAIVGGGATGVEMAGAIAGIARETLQSDFRNVHARDAAIKLIEAGPRILPGLTPRLSAYAERSLTRLGVEVLTSTAVTGCGPHGVETSKGFIGAATVIWAAGVVASPVAQWLGVAGDRAGCIEVADDLSVPGRPEIFVIGDAAAVRGAGGALAPGMASAAKQMGRYVGRRIRDRIDGGPAKPFRYRHWGDLAVIWRNAAVVKMGRFELTGFAGWLLWSAAHIYFLIGARNRLAVAMNWFWNYLTFEPAARLIVDYEPGRRSGEGAVPQETALADRRPR